MAQPRDGILRRLIRAGAGLVAALGAFYGALLAITGGFDLRLFGHSVTSHEPFRPLLIAAAALAGVMLSGGDVRIMRRLAGAADRLPRLVSDRNCILAATALTAVVLAVSVANVSKLGGGSDSFGYLSEADLWRDGGRLSVPIPWARDVPWPEPLWSFTPLAYRPSPTNTAVEFAGYRPSFEQWSIVPTYSPGLPMLMAAARWLGGQSSVFLVVPVTGALFTLATFGVGRRLGSSRLGLIAALLVSASTTTVRLEIVSMSDVPVAAAWTLAWWAALGQTMRSAWAAALAAAAMLLIRPNLLPIAGVMIAWLLWRVVEHRDTRRRHLARAVVIGAGLGGGMLATAIVYWLAYGSPFVSGYGNVSELFGLPNIVPNLRNYSRWFLEEQTILGFVGIAALFVPVSRLWPGVRDRSVVVAFAVSLLLLLAEFCYFSVFDNESYLRFFLPVYPLVMCGLAAAGLAVARRGRRAALGIAAIVVLFGILGIRSARPALDGWRGDARFLALLAEIRSETPENSVILSMQHSGSVRYHAGRVSLRWDYLAPEWLDRAVDWMAQRGVRTYAVLDSWEIDYVRRKFAGQSKAAVFTAPPVLKIENRFLFDLTTPSGSPASTAVTDGPPSRRALPSVPLPVLVWRH